MAPDFELAGTDGRTGEFRCLHAVGVPAAIRSCSSFYPADNSPVCTRQLAEYTAGIAEFDSFGAQVLAISPQSPEIHLEFASGQGGFAFPLLSDEDRSVGRAYGVLGLLDLYRRSTFVVDRAGRIAYLHRYIGPGLSFRSVEELTGVLGTL